MTATLDIRTLSQTRETLVYADGGLFPVLTVAPGDVVVGVLRGGAGHMGIPGRIEIVRSLDAGRSWTPPSVIADSDRDDRNPAIGVAGDGSVVLAYHRQGSYNEAGNAHHVGRGGGVRPPVEVMITRSADSGLTWEAPRPLGVDLLSTGSAFGRIVTQADGTLLLPIYLVDHAAAFSAREEMLRQDPERFGSYLVRSHDDGRTWGDPSLIAPAMDETGLLVLPDGDLLAMLRGTDAEAALWSARSGDGGRSWSDPVQVTGPHQHPGDVWLLANGDVLLSYGNRNPPYRIEGRIGRDGGRRWLDGVIAFSGPLYGANVDTPRRTDLGYASSVVVRGAGQGHGVTMYYLNPSLPSSGDWRDEGPNGPLFSARGYRAIAVTWDEAELLDAIKRQMA